MDRTTRLLNRLAGGDQEAAEEVLPLVYGELRKLAGGHMRAQDRDHTLQATALVNEAWLRLVDQDSAAFGTRAQFYALASRVMRSILVDHARARGAAKRGGGRQRVTLSGGGDTPEGAAEPLDVLALHEALERLSGVDPDLAQLVELRFFGGLTHAEVAEVTGSSLRSVERSWRFAKAWLAGELRR